MIRLGGRPFGGRWYPGVLALLLAAMVAAAAVGGTAGGDAKKNKKRSWRPAASFALVRSAAAEAAGCLEGATGAVRILELGFAERLDVAVAGLPPDTEFDLFVIQVPDAPFGLAWYQGDLETDRNGKARRSFVGRFSAETFIVGRPPAQPAPVVHDDGPFPDASANPPVPDPVHTAHLGLWFNAPADAAAAGCGNGATPFNGDHTAGAQVLSTTGFADAAGPLLQVAS